MVTQTVITLRANQLFTLKLESTGAAVFFFSHKYTRKQDGSSFFFPLKFSSINAVQNVNVIEISLLSVSDDLVLSTELIM